MSPWPGLVYHQGMQYRRGSSHGVFQLLLPLLHALGDSETAARIRLSRVANENFLSLCSADRDSLALLVSFNLGSAHWAVVTNPLVRAGLSSQTPRPQVSHLAQTGRPRCYGGRSVTSRWAKPIHGPEVSVDPTKFFQDMESLARPRQLLCPKFLPRNQPGAR